MIHHLDKEVVDKLKDRLGNITNKIEEIRMYLIETYPASELLERMPVTMALNEINHNLFVAAGLIDMAIHRAKSVREK